MHVLRVHLDDVTEDLGSCTELEGRERRSDLSKRGESERVSRSVRYRASEGKKEGKTTKEARLTSSTERPDPLPPCSFSGTASPASDSFLTPRDSDSSFELLSSFLRGWTPVSLSLPPTRPVGAGLAVGLLRGAVFFERVGLAGGGDEVGGGMGTLGIWKTAGRSDGQRKKGQDEGKGEGVERREEGARGRSKIEERTFLMT